ncbi:MAG: type VI secretion system TssO [Ferruginibacter sp.]
MQPTNRSERRKARLNFMLLFLVCSAIIITTVFYSSRIPIKQNNQLLEFKNIAVKNAELKSDFSDQFIVISKMVDDLGNKTPEEIKVAGIEIENKITELTKMVGEWNNEDKVLYQHVLRNLTNYHAAKEAVKEGMVSTGKDKDLEDKILKLREDNSDLLDKLGKCREEKLKN